MNLSDRKKKILQLVVDDYISTASPISSKQIHDSHLKEVSSATIRNELSALEDMGYLIQPHSSAGRVPSNKAYEIYVNELMKRETLSGTELNYIARYFDGQVLKVEDLVKAAARVISDMTNYPAVAMTKRNKNARITDIRLIKITEDQSLLVVVIDGTTIKDIIINNPTQSDNMIIESASMILTTMFKDKVISELLLSEERLEKEFYNFRYFFKSIINALRDYVNGEDGELVFKGQSKILQYPEYSDMKKAKQFFEVMDSKKLLISMLNESNDMQITINIGNEKKNKGLPTDCSIVTATCKVGDKTIGSAGVIGPSRMNYGKVISVLDSVGSIIATIANGEKQLKSGSSEEE